MDIRLKETKLLLHVCNTALVMTFCFTSFYYNIGRQNIIVSTSCAYVSFSFDGSCFGRTIGIFESLNFKVGSQRSEKCIVIILL